MMPVNHKSVPSLPIGWGEGCNGGFRRFLEASFSGITFQLFGCFVLARRPLTPSLSPSDGERARERGRMNRRRISGDRFPWVSVLHDPLGNVVKIECLGTFNGIQFFPMQRGRNRRAGKAAHTVRGNYRLRLAVA